MNVIRGLRISNFRSIKNLELTNHEIKNLNVFVGNNDVGKSNILKALNLFFNEETELGRKFDFEEDYNKRSPRTSGRGQFVRIVVDLNLRYEKDKYVRLTKTWWSNGNYKEEEQVYSTKDNSPSSWASSSRAPSYIKSLIFRYVPAIKSEQFFSFLMQELHDTINETYNDRFSEVVKGFLENLNDLTEDITEEIQNDLKILHKISLPTDFKPIFSELDFSFEDEGKIYYLSKRGDGIKVRHLPYILKYLAENSSKSVRGSLKRDTIWGFEEPENNLELLHVFALKEKFIEYSNDIQIFVTTHSPGFYTLTSDKNPNTNIFYINRNSEGNTRIELLNESTQIDVDDEMGLLPLITHHISEKVAELSNVKATVKSLSEKIKKYETPIVYTEGKTDVIILKTAWSKLYPTKNIPFELLPIQTYSANGGDGGYSSLNRKLEQVKSEEVLQIGLYDRDESGFFRGFDKLNKNFEVDTSFEFVKHHKNGRSHAIVIPSQDGLEDFVQYNNLPIEFLFDKKYLKRKNKEGKGLILKPYQQKIMFGGEICDTIEKEELHFCSIGSSSKKFFAEEIVPGFEKDAFLSFQLIFDAILKILEDYSD